MQKIFFIAIIVLYGISFSTKAQNALDVERIFNLYPNQQLVYLSRQENIDIKTNKNVLSVISHNSEKMLLLKKSFSNVRSKKIYTSEFVKVNNLHVYLHVYNGKKHSRKEINSIELKSEHSDESGIFYDDAKFYNITFYDAKEGDIVEIEYDQEWAEPRFFGSLFFSDFYPVLKTTYSINCQNDIVLTSKEFNNQNLNYKYTKTPGSKKTIHTWELDTIKPLIDEDFDPSFKKKASYINFGIESFQKNGETSPVCGNLKNLYKWYNELLKDVDISNDEYLIKLSDSITAGAENPEEKMKRIFYWVQSKIAYLAYEDGLGGYVPREAVVVAKRKFGDCKDMANLIVRLGQIAKLPVYRTWIGTRDIPFQFSEFPAPFCANHMIATYLGQKDTIFLDATGRFYPFGMPTAMIQGKEGLIGINETEFLIKKVPVQETKVNIEHDSIILDLSDGNKLKGRGFYKLYGYEKISLMHLLGNKSYKWQKSIYKVF